MTTKTYWITTALLAFVLISGGIAQLLHLSSNVEGLQHLGYPLYVLNLLGIWKILGGITVLAPGLPRLKEWAYAGVVFDLTGAAYSHIAVGDGTGWIAPFLITLIALASWALRPASRR